MKDGVYQYGSISCLGYPLCQTHKMVHGGHQWWWWIHVTTFKILSVPISPCRMRLDCHWNWRYWYRYMYVQWALSLDNRLYHRLWSYYTYAANAFRLPSLQRLTMLNVCNLLKKSVILEACSRSVLPLEKRSHQFFYHLLFFCTICQYHI